MSARWDLRTFLAGAWLTGLGLVTVAGPWMTPAPVLAGDIPLSEPGWGHLLGTDGQGQDMVAVLVHGALPTLGLALMTGLGTTLVGALVALAVALSGRVVAGALTVATEVVLVIPGLPLMVLLAAWLPPGPLTMAAVLTITGWAWSARVLRGPASALVGRAFVRLSLHAGESRARVAVVEILPHLALQLLAALLGATTWAIAAATGLEFIGLGDVGRNTWGTSLYWATNDAALLTGSWWTFVPQGLLIALTASALAALQGGVEVLLDPRMASRARWSEVVGVQGVLSDTPVLGGRDG